MAEYYRLLASSKIVFSANLQETLGISCYEGALVDAIPMVPDRLSYREMYNEQFKYPSEWTENYDSYLKYKTQLCMAIVNYIENYENILAQLHQQTIKLSEKFFSADNLLKNIK